MGSIAETEPEGALPLDEIESDIVVSEPCTSSGGSREDSDRQDDSPANSNDVDAQDLTDDDERELWTENTHPANVRNFIMPDGRQTIATETN